MICPECGEPTPPGPMDLRCWSEGEAPGVRSSIRRGFGSLRRLLGESDKTRCAAIDPTFRR